MMIIKLKIWIMVWRVVKNIFEIYSSYVQHFLFFFDKPQALDYVQGYR